MDMAYKLEGIVRNVGRHAGGVVIAPSALRTLYRCIRKIRWRFGIAVRHDRCGTGGPREV